MIGLMFAAMIAAPAPAIDTRQMGAETVINFAANGGLRGWDPGEPRSGIVYVRDRRERWYQVTLTGPCVTNRSLDELTYTTDNTGTFDRFSRVKVGQYPNQVCGVTSIRNSLPPKGQAGYKPS